MRLMKVDDHRVKDGEKQNLTFHTLDNGRVLPRNGGHPSSSQYLNMQQVPTLVNSSKTINSLLNNSELLHNGDIIGTNTLDRYMGHEYEGELTHEELTEDDRRLAAALVAVQLVNQQKQQNGSHILPLLPTTSLQVDNSKLVSVPESDHTGLSPLSKAAYSASPAGLVDTGALPYGQLPNLQLQPLHPLPPLKKVLNRSRYEEAGIVNSGTNPLDPLGIHSEMLNEIDSGVDKAENIDFILTSDGKEEFEAEKDTYGNDLDSENSRRQSLPHKKRIPRRLRQPKSKNLANLSGQSRSPSTPQNPDGSSTMSYLESFTCQLCCQNFTNQWNFFEHLKLHYEISQPIADSSSSAKQEERAEQQENREEPESFLLPAAPRPTSQRVTRSSAAQPPVESQTTRSVKESTRFASSTSGQSKWPDDNFVAQQVLYQCHVCKRVFRRPKAWENHLATHKDEIAASEEFSEPEDMMEGIKVDVASDDEALDIEIKEEGKWCENQELYTPEEGELSVAEIDVSDLNIKVVDSNTISIQLEKGEEEVPAEQPEAASTEPVNPNDPESVEARTCAICGTLFESRKEATAHINSAHKDVMSAITKCTRRVARNNPRKTLTCTHCDRTFNHMNSLNYHLKSHTGVRDFPCKTCGKSFLAKGALKVHLRQHTGVKPFKCEFCGRCFRQWGDVKYHVISIHSNQKNYQCEYCGKDFARKYSLTVHSRIHTGERNYKCNVCDKSFRAASYLSNHARIHTGERPHPCEICGKPFRVRSDMRRHMMRHKDYFPKDLRGKNTMRGETSNSRDESSHSQNNSSMIPNEMCQVEPLANVDRMMAKTVGRPATEGETARATTNLEAAQREHNALYFWQVFPT